MSAPPVVSVVIPTARRPYLLRRCLYALLRQSLPAARYEIVVVDDGRSAATRAVVEALAERAPAGPAIAYVQPPAGARGPAAARNAGWRLAAAPLVAFTDDDTVPAADWLAEGCAAVGAGADAVWGQVRVPLPRDPTDWARNTAGLEDAGFVTANCFVRRAALDAVGGFDERFTRAWREDSDLCFSLLDRGLTVAHAPRALVLHPVRAAPWGASIGQQRNNFFEPLLYKKHPARYRHDIAAAAPRRYYAAVAALLAAALAAAAGLPLAAAAACAAWLALTLDFVRRRLRATSRRLAHVLEMLVTSAVIPVVAVYWRLRGAAHFGVWFV